MTVSVLFVCLGNICRSPTAEAVFRQRAAAAGLLAQLRIDSAGTGDWHIGKAPDPRSGEAAGQRGYDLSALRARQVATTDFQHFDYVLAMDHANLHDLQAMRPDGFSGHLGLFMAFHPGPAPAEVPDPYYGGRDGFNTVLDLVEGACDGLLAHLRREHGLG